MSHAIHARIGRDKYRMDIRTLDGPALTLIADEPVDAGGSGLGFSPHQLLAAALGACTNATLRMYADRKGWPLEAIDTDVVIASGEDRDTTRIQCTITFTGDLDETQRKRLLYIAERCPIHRALSGTVTIATELVTSAA